MKSILGIIAFTLTFGLSAGLVGILFGFPQSHNNSYVSTVRNNSVYQGKISRLLSRDVSNGGAREKAYYEFYGGDTESLYKNDEYRQAVNEYYISSSSMNDSITPEDFKYAWREHMNAWKNQAEYLNSLQNENYGRNDETAANYYIDNTVQINRTWFQVLRIANRYGVEIPNNYYH